MFVQVIEGQVRDPEGARSHLERWQEDICPGAVGILGSMAGVTDDGWLVHTARFRSAGDAGANSARPEQLAWWEEMEGLLEGPVRFHDCTDVVLLGDEDNDRAGFVQVIQWPDPEGRPLPRIAASLEAFLQKHRPDVIGAVLGRGEDGTVTQVVYFTSEEEARQQEAKELPADDARVLEELWGARDTEPRYYDLRAPLLLSA
jgi:hypothetical protein